MAGQDWICSVCNEPADYSVCGRKFCGRHWEKYINIPGADMSKKFSIIFPTRERYSLLDSILSSIVKNTHNILDVEILVAYDDDDAVTEDYARFGACTSFVKWFRVPRSLNFSRDYYSMLAKQAVGRWIVVVNDDAEFVTPNWDVIADEALSKAVGQGPDIIYGWVEDNLGKDRLTRFNNYTCFPVLGKKGVDILGYVFPERIPTWGADIWVRYLYGQLNNRVVEIPIGIHHFCHHNGTREQDAINKRIADNQVNICMTPLDEEVNVLLRELRK